MAREVVIPEKEKKVQRSGGQLSKFLTVAGGIGGAAFGPGGALAGAGAGAALGKLAGDIVDPVKERVVERQPQGGTSSALSRRREELERDDLSALEKAEQAAATLPESQRQQVLPTIAQARLLEQRKRGIT